MAAETLQRVFKTLNDPTRLRILSLLHQEELSVQELMQILDMAQSTVSRHLGILREAGLLQDRREGTYAYYRFGPPRQGEWSDAWSMSTRALKNDPAVARDQAALNVVLQQREIKSRKWFDRIGSEWDALRLVFNDDLHRARAVASLLPRNMTVADIGTGTGVLATELAEYGLSVIAVDNSPAMLRAARKNIETAGLTESIDLREGEATKLPIEDGELDAAMAHMVLQYVASPGDVVQEMARVVKPAGRVVVVDFVQHGHEWMKEEMGVLWQGFESGVLTNWFEEAGLGDVHLIEQSAAPGARDLPATWIASATKLEGANNGGAS